ncbi:MAG: carboxylesterase family protein, partial [Polyangiales bacterium]
MTFRSLGLILTLVAACGDDGTPAPDAPDESACVPAAGAPAERVTTTSGVVRGARDGETWAYKRVPFAAAPTGARRLASPAPAVCAAGEIDATALGPMCPQLDEGVYLGEEDCLQLNVWAPAAASAPRPVMLWIHGGGHRVGAGWVYDGSNFARDGVVV